MEFRTARLPTQWGEMFVPEAGAGEPMILVHGLGVSGTYFLRAGHLLSLHFHVFIPDMPGSGRSAKPWHVLNTCELADTLAAWSSASNLGPAHWVANSFGCQVVADLALRYPELVKSLVLLGPTIDLKARTTVHQSVRLALDATREPFSEVLIALADYARFGLLRFVRTFFYALADKIETKLPHITAPTLVMRGARDPIVPQAWAEHLTALLPRGELSVVPDSAHTVHYSAPEEFVLRVLRFIARSAVAEHERHHERAR